MRLTKYSKDTGTLIGNESIYITMVRIYNPSYPHDPSSTTGSRSCLANPKALHRTPIKATSRSEELFFQRGENKYIYI